MEFFSIASGSSGNCLCLGDGSNYFLIDCGISGKKIEEGLLEKSVDINDIKGIFVTHEHRDHITALGVLARRYSFPIYITQKTKSVIIENNLAGKIPPQLFHEIDVGKEFFVLGYRIIANPISHDAIDPVFYTFMKDKSKIAVLTDLGTYDDSIISCLLDVNLLYIEANHDIRMLETGIYPFHLKKRILSDIGHLSNEASGKLINKVLHENLKEIILGHLSEENNFPDLALETVKLEITLSDNIFRARNFSFSVAPRNNVSKTFIF